MLYSICFVTLWTLVLSRPASSKLGVDITKVGTMTIGVDGDELRYSVAGCADTYKIWYPTTKTGTRRPGYCVISNEKSSGEAGWNSNENDVLCSLNSDSNGLIEIEVEELPAGCTVSLTNAFLPPDDDASSDGVPIVAIVIPSLIGALLLLLGVAILGFFVFRPCYKRRKAAARAARAAQEIDAQPAASDSLPTALPPTAALSSSAAPEAPNRSRRNKNEKTMTKIDENLTTVKKLSS